MSNAVWAHDVRLIPSEGAVYSEWQFPAVQWERHLRRFDRLRVLARRGEQVPGSPGPARLERTSRAGVDFVLLPNLSGLRGKIVERPSASARMRGVIGAAEGVVARLPSEIGLAAADLGLALGKPVAIELVTCGWDSLGSHGSLRARVYAPLMHARVRRAVRRAGHVLYVTRSFLQGRYPTPAANTAACSNVEIPRPDPEVLARRLAREPRSPFELGLIATLQTRAKGIQTALRAFSNVRLRVPGNGDPAPWEAEARTLGVAPRVAVKVLLGAGEPVLHWLNGLDCYPQPSLQDGVPRAPIEALRRGRPAIGSDCGGIPESLDAHCLAPPGDHQALARLMLRALHDADWRRAQAARNHAVAGRYAGPVLETRRDRFWSAFAADCRRGAGPGGRPKGPDRREPRGARPHG